MIELNESNFEEEVKNGIVIVDFYAPWCGPCKIMGSIFKKMSAEITDVKIVSINVDDNPNLATKFEVTSIPVIMFMKDGKIVSQNVGVMPEANINKMIEMIKTKPE